MKIIVIFTLSILFNICLLSQVNRQITTLENEIKAKVSRYDAKDLELVDSYLDLIELLYENAKYYDAIENSKKCIDFYLETFDEKQPKTAILYDYIGRAYNAIGEYDKALSYLQKALAIDQEILGEEHSWTAISYNNISAVYYEIGNYQKALQHYKRALNIYLKVLGEKHSSTASTYNNLGAIYSTTGDYIKAMFYYQKSIEILLEVVGVKNSLTASAYINLGEVYQQMGDYPNAIKYYKKAIKIFLKLLGEKHPTLSKAYNNLGKVYKTNGDYIKALLNYQKALAINQEVLGEKHPQVAETFESLSDFYNETGNYKSGIKYNKKALIVNLEVLGEKHPYTIATQTSLALSFEALSEYIKADSLWNIIIPNTEDQLRKIYLFLPDNKRLFYLNKFNQRLSSFYSFANFFGSENTKLLAADLIINTKHQILDYAISTRELIENIKDENLDSIAFQLNSINQKVAQAELLNKHELAEKGWSLDSIHLQQDELASQILEHPELKAKLNPAKFSWQQIQRKLKADEALIDYFTFYDKVDSARVYQAMLIKKDEPKPIFIPLSVTKPVVDLLKTKERLPLYTQYKEARQKMYRYLWLALEPHLENIKTMHLTPVASLNKIDFGSLQNEEGQYLADLYNFHYYSSSKDFFKLNHSKPKYTDATLYGHIAYYAAQQKHYKAEEDSFALRLHRDTLRALPATLPEVKAIEEICSKHKVSPTLLTINEAKEDTIEYFSANRAPSIMHFATHGVYLPPLAKKEETSAMVSLSGEDRFRAADNPLQRSMLMLSNAGDTWKSNGPNIVTENDGILTALEVTNLDLSNTELVVLSACNSGIGSQHTTEGVFGLPRAFKLAGVDKILVSLWPVEDETTKELMILFYTNLLQHKQDAATALRNAKAEMRKRDDRPKKWAGFILIE